MSRILTYAFATLFFASLMACGGSGGGGGNGDTSPPAITILFPGSASLTDAATVIVRGTGTDGSGISALAVNGVAATTADMFANWTATIPLVVGPNVITVDATDGAMNNNPTAAMATIERNPTATTTGSVGTGPAFIIPEDLLIDEARMRLIAADSGGLSGGRVVTVDLATGNRAILSSDAGTGGGTPAALGSADGITANFPGSAVYVTDQVFDLVVMVNIFTGLRTVTSDNAVGGAPNFTTPTGIVYNASNQNVIWGSNTENHVLTAPVATGVRSVVTDNADTGPALSSPESIVHDVSNNRVLIAENEVAGSIVAADLTTGNRTLIASGAMGTGGPAGFNSPSGLALDLVGNRLVTHLSGSDATVFVDLATGNRTTISANAGPGTGPSFGTGVSVAHDGVKQLVYVFDQAFDAVYLVDATNGSRVIMSR